MAGSSDSLLNKYKREWDGWFERHEAQLEEIQVKVDQITNDPVSMTGLGIILLYAFVAIFAPFIAPYDPTAQDLLVTFEPPSLAHPFGTDNLGRDIFSRVIFGSRISAQIAIIVVAISIAIGVPMGLTAGFIGGWFDELIMRIADIFLGFPPLLLPIAISVSLGGGLYIAAVAVAVTWWPWYARIARSEAVSLREEDYVTAAEGIGVSTPRIVARHILPNSIAPILVQASIDMGYAILITASLSFIGAGAQPPTPEWGLMITTARTNFITHPWTAAFPGLAIFITVLGFNMFGDGIRDALDPKLSRR
ncbi:MAG: ABC transporter permease [Halobacteriales archaeon]